jgi:glutaminase
MTHIKTEDIQQILDVNRQYATKGKPADYIPELSGADPHAVGITIASLQGDPLSVGNCQTTFTLQSISKVISLIVALMDYGPELVFSKVGMEPTGDPFNSIVRLETFEQHKPFNPLINAGAIAVASLIKGEGVQERFDRTCQLLYEMTGNPQITLNESVYVSEKKTGYRNRSLGYFMKGADVIVSNVDAALDLYFRLCSINVTCSDLAKIGSCLANCGTLPGSETQLIDPEIVKIALTVMMTSGMYNASGEFAVRVGIPAKSGVSGGIMAVVPGRMGIGVIGPAIDEKGNSVAGVRILQDLSKKYHFHQFLPEKIFR